ncbi:hypothetical protein H6G04_12385 [Calothrix membranacea FACHB-236]|nr:hypothetical protein [Calothrix membranacea FACHB-236]
MITLDKIKILICFHFITWMLFTSLYSWFILGWNHQAVQTDVVARQHFEEVTAITVLPVFCLYHSLALLSLPLDASNCQKVASTARRNSKFVLKSLLNGGNPRTQLLSSTRYANAKFKIQN